MVFLLDVQGTLKSLLQHYSSKASILHCSAFFIMVQLSHLYMTTGKTIALTIGTFISKVMSLLSNTMAKFIIASLSRSRSLFNFMAVVTVHSDFGFKKIKFVTVSIFFASVCHEVLGPDAIIFVF